MKLAGSLIILLIVIPSLLIIVWLINPSDHPVILVASGGGVFVALGIFRALRPKSWGAIIVAEENKKQIRYGVVLLTTVVGPLVAAFFSVFFPNLIMPIIVTVMCVASLLSILIRDLLLGQEGESKSQ